MNQKKAEISILISDRENFRSKKVIRDEEGHYVMIEESILEKDILIFNVYVQNNRVSKCIGWKLIELQGKINEWTIIVGVFNTALPEMDRFSWQKIGKDIVELSNTINQQNIMDIYGLLHPTTAEYTWNTDQGNHILGHKTHTNKFKRIEVIQCLVSDHNGIKLIPGKIARYFGDQTTYF